MSKKRLRQSNKNKILLSAIMVGLSEGFGQVTLDAVSRRASVSKGGLLYHFPNKFRLVEALIDEFVLSPAADFFDEQAIDARSVALLIAASESPDFIESTASALGIKIGETAIKSSGLPWDLLAACLWRHSTGDTAQSQRDRTTDKAEENSNHVSE